MARQLFWLLLIVTASIAIGLWLRPGWPAPPTVHVQPRDAQSWLLQLAAAGQPAIVRGACVTSWRAMSTWTPAFLAKKLPTVYGAYANSHRHFGPYYDASRPLAPFTRPANVYATDVNTTVAELLQSDRPGRLVRYLSQDLSALPPELEADLQPLQPLLAPNPQRSSVNLWLGPAGAIAHGHYDGYHNAFVQLKGRKRFILLPPTAWSVLGVYPFLHPHHAQAAANLSRIFPELALPDLMKTEAAAMSEEHGRLRKQLQDQLVVADLQPGDVLYLPPLWFHHVVALEPSISVNVWTEPNSVDDIGRLFDSSLEQVQKVVTAAGGCSDAACRCRATFAMAHSVLRSCGGSSSITANTSEFMRAVAEMRFQTAAYRASLQQPEPVWEQALFCREEPLPKVPADVTKGLCQYMRAVPVIERGLWLGNWLEALALSCVPQQPLLVGAVLAQAAECRI